MPQLSFVKYSGCGNDFVLIDNRKQVWPHVAATQITALCDRHFGIGADGVVLWEQGASDHVMRIFNADGTQAEMCGNGLRCLYHFICQTLGDWQPRQICTQAGKYRLSGTPDSITAEVPPPSEIEWNLSLELEDCSLPVSALNTGVPHAVTIGEPELFERYAVSIRRHPAFFKRGGVNANIATEVRPGLLRLRTFERGVEGETLACGTGATATALAYSHHFNYQHDVEVVVASGETLTIGFEATPQGFSNITCTGTARAIFAGTIDLPAG